MKDETNEFEDLERAMRQMPLRTPSPELDRRIEQTLNRHSRSHLRWVIGLAAGTLAAAAALLLIVRATGTQTDITPAPAQPAPTLVAAATQNPTPAAKPAVTQLVQTDEEWSEDGIVSVQSDGPVRQYRVTTTHQITEVEDGKLATMTFPQEEVYQVVSQAF